MEQALPLRADWLNFNRFRARAEHTIPMGPYRLLLCGKGAPLLRQSLPVPYGVCFACRCLWTSDVWCPVGLV